MVSVSEAVALSIFSSYFLLILGLFLAILKSLSNKTPGENGSKFVVFAMLAVASFAHTWYYMFKFMAWSFYDYESTQGTSSNGFFTRLTGWLINTKLFEQAWATVCATRENWWWSQQLCLFTVGTWTVFLATKGRRYSIKHVWMYMVFGQIVAISVASNLFYMALLLNQSTPRKASNPSLTVDSRVWLPVTLSLVTVILSPYTSSETFLPNLLVMHALIIIPLLSQAPSTSRFLVKTRTLYCLAFVVSLTLHLSLTYKTAFLSSNSAVPTLSEAVSRLWNTLHSHPAQSSIGWDVIWTTISSAVWMGMTAEEGEEKTLQHMLSVVAAPIASVSSSAAWFMWRRSEGEKYKQL